MKDSLGDRMKTYYEDRTRVYLPRRTYTLIRIDGKAFHTYTKGLPRPFDDKLMSDMDETAKFLCKEIQGCKFGFVQSDEISLLVTDFTTLLTSSYFDGELRKICSLSASFATAKFNELRPGKLAFFDSRAWTIPSPTEVENYFIWRQQDTVRNSISSLAQSLFSPKQLHGKNVSEMKEMCLSKGHVWDDLSARYKQGRLIVKEEYEVSNQAIRTRWTMKEPDLFTENREQIISLIPLDI